MLSASLFLCFSASPARLDATYLIDRIDRKDVFAGRYGMRRTERLVLRQGDRTWTVLLPPAHTRFLGAKASFRVGDPVQLSVIPGTSAELRIDWTQISRTR
ncbi:MAG TPA: hypothetical protein PLO61_09415 [Fimbriimonadaceae bacterium]|nr:hypothetical protein [Fimbriimonadaceae bacterium]HRJ33848.1 hypothetical protein [Fimbriimonadaceae bacterium]